MRRKMYCNYVGIIFFNWTKPAFAHHEILANFTDDDNQGSAYKYKQLEPKTKHVDCSLY